MPRVMDDTFHRLLWITLVAVAFTFTVILTSVFVDIDDLLAKRSSPVMKQQSVTEVPRTELPAVLGNFQSMSNEEDANENESTFRTKRSLETNNYLLYIKNPKLKKILTNRLATLLEELDEEELLKANNAEGEVIELKDKNIENPKYLNIEETTTNIASMLDNKDTSYDKIGNKVNHESVLHLAMHNILLQGIKGHMDLNEVYKKVHLLLKSFESNLDSDAKEIYKSKLNKSKPTELMKIISHDSYKEEDNFFNELIKCDKLQKQILQIQDLRTTDKKETDKDSHILIKTIIEITNNNKGNENFKHSDKNVTGAVKLIYNGKDIKSGNFIEGKNEETEEVQNTHVEGNQHNKEPFAKKFNTEWQNIKESELNQVLSEYLKNHSMKFQNKYNIMTKGSFVTKRLKRQIKIRYLDGLVTTEKSKGLKQKPKHHDDELYVEIETHFDGKGTKGEKKKKLVRSLIDKIQKAINSNVEVIDQDKIFQQKHLQIKKRLQNPIDYNELFINTISPKDVIERRQLNPISKTANVIQPLTSVLDKFGDTWKKVYDGPSFLAASKSLNSAEMRELDVDYNSVMKNGIPKRLQKPINTENEDLMKLNEYVDMGNVTLFLKDINGSGFSVGINQYVDEAPDKESLKMFTGLENLIQAYHEHYNQNGVLSNESEEQIDYIADSKHKIKRRDINKQIKFTKQWLTTDKFLDKKNDKVKRFVGFTRSDRHKRSAMNVKLLSNIKSKTKLNKYINTNAMPRKKIFLKSKRNKRQIDQIRIVASDRYPSTSREDIFLVSRENIYSDRAIVKEEETPEVEISDRNEEHYDFIAPYSYNMHIPNLQSAYLSSVYDTKSLHTGLMSRYPHILLENISRSKEFINVSPINTTEEKSYHKLNSKTSIHTINDDKSIEKNISSTNIDEIVNAILPSRNNFKMVVKILPKNKTNVGPGYKEVHTLINESYAKNGIRYVSSLNVSEVSKFENFNKTKKEILRTTESNDEMERRQSQIKLLLELHKERIDQQLEHLKMESQKLKEMIGHDNLNKNISDLIDVFNQVGLKSLYGKDGFHLNTSKPNIRATVITNTLLPKSETTKIPPFATTNKQEDLDNMKILNSVKQNENITREILRKIDNNANTFQLFIQKVFDQVHAQSTSQVVVNTEKVVTNNSPQQLKGNLAIHPYFEHLNTSFTNAIPFVYAFQRPLTENNDRPLKTIANVVYHGHIHANKVGNDGKRNDFLKNIANNFNDVSNKKINNYRGTNGNETKFFIDELDNDFKLVSNVMPVLNHVKTNTTKT